MNLRRLGEVGFLRALVRRHRALMPPSPAGPGDDAAVLGDLLLTADALVEGEHFLAGEPPFLLGRKALSVNLSDIAAMGGTPSAFLLCLGLPSAVPGKFLDGLLAGIASAAAEHRVAWIGGDTVRSKRGIVIAITAIGRKGRRLLTRSGARPGDGIYVTGPLGASAAGRALLARGWRVRSAARPGRWRTLSAARAAARLAPSVSSPRGRRVRDAKEIRYAAENLAAHLDPVPRLAAGLILSRRGLVSAAIDLSDGLSLDLHRLCEASGAGALIYKEAIPISHATRAVAARMGWDPLKLALNGGEDYELLFTSPRRSEKALLRWPLDDGTGPILIGRVTPRRRRLLLENARGKTRLLQAQGYDPFTVD
jgi:thiamine-monophosphate kinase